MGRKMKYRCGIWTVLFFLWTASAMTGCARREEVFLEELDSDEENSNRKAGEESTAYESNVAAGENPEKQSAVSDAGSEGNTENSDLSPSFNASGTFAIASSSSSDTSFSVGT